MNKISSSNNFKCSVYVFNPIRLAIQMIGLEVRSWQTKKSLVLLSTNRLKKDNKSPSDMRNRCSLNDDVLFFVAFFSLLNDDVPLTSGSIRVVSMELNR